MNNRQKEKGITLIALAVTIVVMLILAGVTIVTLNGENGIITQSAKSKEANEIEKVEEIAKLEYTNLIMEKQIDAVGDEVTLENIKEKMKEQGYEIEEKDGKSYIKIGKFYYEIKLENQEVSIAKEKSEGITGGVSKIFISTKYYSSLQNAISDANNDVTTNGVDDSTGAKAKIAIDEKNNVYVLPLEDVLLNTIVQVGSVKGYTLDLNGKTLTFSEGNHFNQLTGTKLTLDDSGTNGNVTKNVNSDSQQNILRSSGELVLNGGTYNLTNNGNGIALNFRMCEATLIANNGTINSINTEAGKATALQISGTNSNTTIYNINCFSQTMSGQAVALFAGKSNSTEGISDIRIDGGNFTCFSKQGNVMTGYFDSKNVTINDGTFNAKNDTGSIVGICAGGVKNDITINNVKINSILTESAFKKYNYGIQIIGTTNNCQINGGEYYVDSNIRDIYTQTAAILAYNSNVEINDGSFIADGKLNDEKNANTLGLLSDSENLVVNGGYFRGTHSGAQICGIANVNGGTFESPNHGGMYLCGNVNIKNTTLKLGTYKGKYSEIENIDHYGVFYIGNTNTESKVYIDNVTLVSDFGNKPGVLSSNYNHKDTYLYVSNTAFPGPIRVDGTRTNSQNPTAKGHLYVGKNVTYSGITTGSGNTTGIVDTTTYENKEFLND